MLQENVSPTQRTKAFIIFASMQTAGLAFGPIVGGGFASQEWRALFIAMAVMCVCFGFFRYPSSVFGKASDGRVSAGRYPALSEMVLPCFLAALMYVMVVGTMTLAVLVAGDRFGPSPLMRGILLATLGIAALITAFPLSRWAAQLGAHIFGVAGLALGGIGISIVAAAPTTTAAISGLLLAGIGSVATRVAMTRLLTRVAPERFAAGASVMFSCQFLGGAVAPVFVTATYGAGVGPATWIVLAASTGVIALLVSGRKRPYPNPLPSSLSDADSSRVGQNSEQPQRLTLAK
jgi:MFS family permease